MGFLQGLGQAKPVSEFITTAGNYQVQQAQLENQRLQQQQLQIQQQQMEKDNKEYHVDAVLPLYPERHRESIKQMWTLSGFVAPDGTIRGKDIRSTPELYKRYPDIALGANVIEIEENEKKLRSPTIAAEEKLKIAENLTDLHRKNAFLRGKEQADKGFTLSEGQQRFDAQGRVIASGLLAPTRTRTIKEGDTERTEEWQNGAWRPIATAPRYKPTTTVNVDVNTGLERGARAKAQEEVQEGTDLYLGLQRVLNISRPEYFTYAGQAQAQAEKYGEKAGILKDPALLKGYSAWKVGVEQEFNKYRKWVTGVAAGPVELGLIRQTFPNKDMSETEFQAAAQQTAITTWKLVERRRRALAAGIMDEGKQKDFYRLLPLDSMPEPPADFMSRFSGGASSGSPRTAEEYLRKRGIR